MDYQFQVFGSQSSQDLDVIIFVDYIEDNPFPALERCKVYNQEIGQWLKTTKEVNANLAILEDGVIKKVLKGTADEVNNSLLRTYDLHQQYFSQKILRSIHRDIELKVLRTARVLLSLISRTQYRAIVKLALQKNFTERLLVLTQCDITKLESQSLVNKNVTWADFIKVYAFQIGQTLALLTGQELYTKEEIMLAYPELAPYLQRDVTADLQDLEKWRIKLLDHMKSLKMESETEYIFGEKK